MKVVKKNGKIEDFNKEKIMISIENASDDVREPLTMSDVENVVNEVVSLLKRENRSEITTHEIRGLVAATLDKFGFTDVAEAYKNFI